MQSVITWEQLSIYLSVFLFLYYAAIILLFYRKDISLIRSSRKNGAPSLAPYVSPSPASTNSTIEPDTILYNSVHELMEDCKPVFQAAVNQQLEKEQVIESLRIRVQRYPQIKGTAFQVAVTNHIAKELDHRLGMILQDDEASALWQYAIKL